MFHFACYLQFDDSRNANSIDKWKYYNSLVLLFINRGQGGQSEVSFFFCTPI